MRYERAGDLKNSDFFEEYIEKIYAWREKNGLLDMIDYIDYVTVDVQPEDREDYIEEITLMTPYRLKVAYEHERYLYTVMEISHQYPAYIIRVDKKPQKKDFVYAMNKLSPVAKKKPYARYIGETYRVKDLNAVHKQLSKSGVLFKYNELQKRPNASFICTEPSRYTWNTFAYLEYDGNERKFAFDHHEQYNESPEFLDRLKKITELREEKIGNLIEPIDHLATRVFHQDREPALLELVKCTSHYYWGSYNIADQNSSTNVTRNTKGYSEFRSPAKVFTAGDLPHTVEFLEEKKSPTEAFVLKYGPRMHHIAYGIKDDQPGQEQQNIDIVVKELKALNKDFLLQVIGSPEEGLKQIFSKTSKLSFLITEYVERYNGFQGFFTKDNVAFLTEAAGHDEAVMATLVNEGKMMGEDNLCD